MIMTILKEVNDELKGAYENYPDINTIHEGYAVILEELDEVWDEIKKKPRERDLTRVRKELIQVIAMAIRTIEDCDL